jgi:hypothetical protein
MMEMANSIIVDYAMSHGIELPHPFSGQLTIVVDDRYRVHMHEGAGNSVVLLCRLASVPTFGLGRDDCLLKMGKFSACLLSTYPSTCVIDKRDFSFWLQQIFRPEGGDSIDESMVQFVNALAVWANELPRLT